MYFRHNNYLILKQVSSNIISPIFIEWRCSDSYNSGLRVHGQGYQLQVAPKFRVTGFNLLVIDVTSKNCLSLREEFITANSGFLLSLIYQQPQ